MIDPNKITNFHRTDSQLQEFLLFSICVAGKNAKVQAKKLDEFLQSIDGLAWDVLGKDCATHFDNLSVIFLEDIENTLRNVKMGQYGRISKAFWDLANSDLDLKSCTVSDLEQISGIGPKTARFFILHSRKGARCAVLDTHVLKHLKNCGVENVPNSTPQNKKEYARLEQEFLKIYDRNHFTSVMTVADYDLIVWQHYSNKK